MYRLGCSYHSHHPELFFFSAGVLGIVTLYLLKQSCTTLIQSLPRSINAKTRAAASADQTAIEKARDRLVDELGICKNRAIDLEKASEILKLNNTNRNARRAQRRLQREEIQGLRQALKVANVKSVCLTQGLETSEIEKSSFRKAHERIAAELKRGNEGNDQKASAS